MRSTLTHHALINVARREFRFKPFMVAELKRHFHEGIDSHIQELVERGEFMQMGDLLQQPKNKPR